MSIPTGAGRTSRPGSTRGSTTTSSRPTDECTGCSRAWRWKTFSIRSSRSSSGRRRSRPRWRSCTASRSCSTARTRPSTAKRDWSYFTAADKSRIFLGGTSVEDLKEYFGVDHNDLLAYFPADPDEIRDRGVEVHYLGYYLKWHPQSCYYYAVEHGGFQASPERTPGTYSKYNSIDDRIDDFHYYTTWIKFGIGRATYDAAQEIRSRDITREEGVALVKRFDGEWPARFDEEIFRYLSLDAAHFPEAVHMFDEPVMSRQYFERLAERFRSPHLWRWTGNGWQLRRAVWHEQAVPA
jgi:hypothetical protein